MCVPRSVRTKSCVEYDLHRLAEFETSNDAGTRGVGFFFSLCIFLPAIFATASHHDDKDDNNNDDDDGCQATPDAGNKFQPFATVLTARQ